MQTKTELYLQMAKSSSKQIIQAQFELKLYNEMISNGLIEAFEKEAIATQWNFDQRIANLLIEYNNYICLAVESELSDKLPKILIPI